MFVFACVPCIFFASLVAYMEDSICVFICLYGNIYTNPNVILCLNIYLVVGNTVHNECRYLPCHCCCFPACVQSSEYSYWVSTVDQVISSSLGTSPQSFPSHLHNTTPDRSTCNLGENIFASNYSKILCAVHAREVPHNTTWSHISLSIKSTQQNAGAGVWVLDI